ncbi:Ppx/GppA phosphatase family protein [Halomicronema hongdechloris]|nr:hypothetical protein [Halomicronema hongdechloris]
MPTAPIAPLAAIDIGSHSALLLIAQYRHGHLDPVVDLARTTHLGEGVVASGQLSEAAMARTLMVLRDYGQILSQYGVDHPVCYGTAALRQAQNTATLQQRVQQELGWSIRVLSGEEEAHYTFRGATAQIPAGGAVVIDIGGGSTEVVMGQQGHIEASWSLPVGAVSLRERFEICDRIPGPIAQAMDVYLAQVFQSIPATTLPLLVTGGTPTTLAALMLNLATYDSRRIDGHCFELEDFEMLYDELNHLSLHQRADLPAMELGRAMVILPALRLLITLMRQLRSLHLTVTVRGPRYGILL